VDNPWAWLAVGLLVLFIVFLNVGLIVALRRKPGAPGDVWSRGLRAMTAGREAHEKQEHDLDELRRRVAALRQPDE
jgi:hypothetical protein